MTLNETTVITVQKYVGQITVICCSKEAYPENSLIELSKEMDVPMFCTLSLSCIFPEPPTIFEIFLCIPVIPIGGRGLPPRGHLTTSEDILVVATSGRDASSI